MKRYYFYTTNMNIFVDDIFIEIKKDKYLSWYLSSEIIQCSFNPTDYIDKEGRTIRVHDAIILNKRECDKEREHPESQSKIDFEERLNEI